MRSHSEDGALGIPPGSAASDVSRDEAFFMSAWGNTATSSTPWQAQEMVAGQRAQLWAEGRLVG